MKIIIAFVLGLITVGCANSKVDKKAEGEKVMQVSREWSKAASAGDLEKTVSYWADSAFLVAAGQPPLIGREAIRKMVEEGFKIPGFEISWEPVMVEVSESGDMAYLIENSQTSFPDSTGKRIILKNKAVTIWRKQADGSWKNVVDISTPDASYDPNVQK